MIILEIIEVRLYDSDGRLHCDTGPAVYKEFFAENWIDGVQKSIIISSDGFKNKLTVFSKKDTDKS